MADVCRRRHVRDQRAEIREAADVIELLHGAERFRQGDDVDRLGVAGERENVAIDEAMRLAVEIFLVDEIADAIGGLVVEKQAAQDRLLRLDGVRWPLERIDLRIVGHGYRPSGPTILLVTPPRRYRSNDHAGARRTKRAAARPFSNETFLL